MNKSCPGKDRGGRSIQAEGKWEKHGEFSFFGEEWGKMRPVARPVL